MKYKTPIMPCENLNIENSISIKREDLLPFSFGGNKVRIAYEFFEDMRLQGKNCIIGYGNAKSNMCRVLANMSCTIMGESGYCHIISSADDDGTYRETNNSLITKTCGAVVHSCKKEEVANTVEKVIKLCEESGMNPYYIYGDKTGHGNEAVPIRAYVKAYNEIEEKFDYIFLATGTGMTQAGLIAGKTLRNGDENIIGISIARRKEQEEPIIQTYVEKYLYSIGKSMPIENVVLDDGYIGKGYGIYSDEICKTIQWVLKQCGVMLDPTYTGKAFYGMLEFLKKNNIKGKKILFIHTGGIPIFFDQSVDVLYRSTK